MAKNFYITAYLLTAFSIIQFNSASSQDISNFVINHITSENVVLEQGLSQNSIHDILQDSKGYMWFATWEGLNKYDGYKFTIYRVNFKEPEKGLSNSNISVLHEDKNGYLWIGTENGLDKFDRGKNSFVHYNYSLSDPFSISNDSILSIEEDKNGYLWIGTQNGLNKFNPETGKFKRYKSDPNNLSKLSDNVVNTLYYDNGILWIGTEIGLSKFNTKTETFKHYFHKTRDTTSISDNHIWDIAKDKAGYFWIATEYGLNKFDPVSENFSRYFHSTENYNSLSNNSVKTVFEDSYGVLWVGTFGGGLDMLDRDTDIFYHFRNIVNDPNSLTNDFIFDIYEDRAGVIWVGTQWKGVNKIDRSVNKYNHYKCISDDDNSLNTNLVWSIIEDRSGLVWIGTLDGGINILNRETGKYTYLRNDPTNENSLCSDKIKSIFEDRDGIFWIGTFDRGLTKYNVKEELFTHYRFNPANLNSLCGDRVNCIIQDKNGYIWISTDDGVSKLDPAAESFRTYRNNPFNSNSLIGNRVNEIYEDLNGYIWMCTYNGISMFNPKNNKFINFVHNPGNKNTISAKGIFSIYQDNSGIYWIATVGGGLDRYDGSTGKFTNYNELHGLSNNVVYNILEDSRGNLWLSTNYGISKFNKQEETFINIDANDGIQGHEFNYGAAFKNRLGQMFFGGMNGFNIFMPDLVRTNKNIPNIVITSFKIFEKELPDEYSDGDSIFLAYSENFFSFEYSALDYSIPSKNKYEYKLEGYDKEWIKTSADRRYAQYAMVEPGTYVFKVKGSNNDGIWNETPLTITVIVKPPWWQMWLFRIPAGTLILGVIWYLIYLRIRRLRKKHEIDTKMLEFEKQIFNVEQKALRLQMNPHFIFNSLNSIQSFVLVNDTDKAINYLAKFAQLMRLILANSREQYVSVAEELKSLSIYLEIEKLRFDDKFDFIINIDPAIDEEFVAIPPMIIQPYVENSILHGVMNKSSKGTIEVDLKLKDNAIYCTVTDNGIGRERARKLKEQSGLKQKSKGMLITKERLEILNRQNKEQFSIDVVDMKNSREMAIGTKVIIKIIYKEI